MKHLLSGIFLFLVLACFGQDKGEKIIEISELKTPTSPAFTLLGVSPNEISRPKSQNDLEVALTNAFYGNQGLQIPKEFALETNPYWLFRKEPMSVREWYGANVLKQLLRNSSVSIATAPRNDQIMVDSSMTNVERQQLAIGIRTQIQPLAKSDKKKIQEFVNAREAFRDLAWIGRFSGGVKNALLPNVGSLGDGFPSKTKEEQVKAVLDLISKKINTVDSFDKDKVSLVKKSIESVSMEILEKGEDYDFTGNFADSRDKILEIISDEIRSRVGWSSMVTRMRDTYNGPTTFLIEFGTAYALHFSDSLIGSGRSSRFGIWLSPTYRTPTSKSGSTQGEVIVMARYLEDCVLPSELKHRRFADVGLRLVLRIKRFSISGEALYRGQFQKFKGSKRVDGDDYLPITDPSLGCADCPLVFGGIPYYKIGAGKLDDWKASFNIEYRVTNSISLTYTFGKDFDSNVISQGGNIMNLIGINLGLFPATAIVKN